MIIVNMFSQYYAFLMDYYSREIIPLDFTKLSGQPISAISTFTLRGKVYLATFRKNIEEVVDNMKLYELDDDGNQTFGWMQQMDLKSYFLSGQLYISSVPFFK